MTGVAAEVGSTANHYQILARLAMGGMAEIFLARGISAPGVERYCVLKRILRNRASDVHFVRMFLDEARLAAQLHHANVAQVYDIGKLGDSYFFTMEYVHGETVRTLVQRARSLRRELPLGSILTVIAGAASGLHHAHTRIGGDGRPLAIVHRDVSPSNLMVGYEGGVKVVDFGVAKAADRMQETKSGTVKGKISYLSPEQCRGHAIDRRSDLFSLGIVLWEMLTTERLYRRSSDFENMTAIVNEPPPPPSSRRAELAPEVDAIALRLLAKDPAARFQTGEELIEALEEAGAKTHTLISSSALGRLLRDMFGQRPEPWLELAEANETADGVTVTSEPIPEELGVPVADAIDLSLSSVPDLGRMPATTSVHEPAAPVAVAPPPTAPTVPAVHTVPRGDAPPEDSPILASRGRAIEPRRPSAALLAGSESRLAIDRASSGPLVPALAVPTPPSLPGKSLAESPPPAVAVDELPTTRTVKHSPELGVTLLGPGVPVEPHGPSAALAPPARPFSGTGPLSYPSASQPAYPPAPTTTTTTATADVVPGSRSARWLLLGVVGAAAVIGSLTVFVVMRTTSSPELEPPQFEAVAPHDPVPAPPPPRPAVEPALPQAPIAAAADEAAPAMPTDDAASESPRGEPSPKASASAPVTSRADTVQAAYLQARYSDVASLCAKGAVADAPMQCAIAACHVGQETRAKQWSSKASSKQRSRIQAACHDLGIDLAPRRPTTDKPEKDKPDKPDKDKPDKPDKPKPAWCDTNPMDCQR